MIESDRRGDIVRFITVESSLLACSDFREVACTVGVSFQPPTLTPVIGIPEILVTLAMVWSNIEKDLVGGLILFFFSVGFFTAG